MLNAQRSPKRARARKNVLNSLNCTLVLGSFEYNAQTTSPASYYHTFVQMELC